MTHPLRLEYPKTLTIDVWGVAGLGKVSTGVKHIARGLNFYNLCGLGLWLIPAVGFYALGPLKPTRTHCKPRCARKGAARDLECHVFHSFYTYCYFFP